MTVQDDRQDPARLAKSPSEVYTRGRGRIGADLALVQPTRLEIGSTQDAPPSAVPVRPPVAAAKRSPGRSPAAVKITPPPLKRRAEEIRADATKARRRADTARALLAVELDYVRAAAAAADKRGMSDPESSAAVEVAIAALRAAGDTLTAAMLIWRPTS